MRWKRLTHVTTMKCFVIAAACNHDWQLLFATSVTQKKSWCLLLPCPLTLVCCLCNSRTYWEEVV